MIEQVYEMLRGNRGNVLTTELIEGICFRLSKLLPPAQPQPQAAPLWEDVAPETYLGYTFAAEPFNGVLPELRHLHHLHWEEVDHGQYAGGVDPNYEGYLERERAGRYCQFTLRKGPLLVGYFGAYLFVNQHNGVLAAKEDTYFICKEHRKGLLATHFIHFAERAMARMGAREFHASVKHAYPAAAKVLQFAGYTPVGTEFIKTLGDGHDAKKRT